MRKRNYLKLLLGMFVMVVSTTFMGCVDDNDDTSAPYLKVTPTSLAFNEDGTPKEGDGSFAVEANRPWRVTMDDEAATWVTVEPASGDGNATVEVRVPATTKGQSAELTFAIYNSYGDLQTQKVTVTQGAVVPAQTIFHTTIGNTAVSSPYPYPDQYEDWNTSGTGAEGVTFSGQNSSVRASGLSNAGAYDGASGPNVVFFGGAPASFTINKIKLTSSQTDLRLTFGGSYSFKNDDGSYDNVFNTDKFHVALSANGTDWKEITYTKNSGDAATPYWVFCTSDFTLDPAVSELYVRFTAEVSSVYRLDDITLATGNGGQIVNLDGDTPTPPVGDEIYNETFGTASVSSPWPYPDQYTDYTKKGSGAATVGYSGQGSSIRNSGLSNAGAYEGASGPNVVFFGTNSPYFVVEGITMPSTTNFQLTFGGSYSKRNDDGSYDNTFDVSKFHVSLSADGTNWKEITYTKNNGDADTPYWVFCTSDFTLKNPTSLLYIRYATDEASVYRLDDITLRTGNGGQVVDLGGGTPPVGDAIYNETFGTMQVSSPWPYPDQYTDYTKTGTGASTVAYSGQGSSIRNSGLSDAGAYDGASGPNVVFFGTNSPYFVVENITMPSTTNFQLTFGGSYSKRNDDGSYDNTFDVAKLHVSLSADGTNWNEITYTKNNGDQDRPYWVFCTADFTLKSATDKLYIRYAADEASVYRLDDMTLKAGNGGQQVDLGGSSQTVTLDVSPMEVTLGNASGATSTFTITTTAAWTATINGSGFTLDKTSGTGNATVTVTSSAANTGTSAATLGTVTVAATGVSASKTVTVKQNGSSPAPGGNEITIDFGQGPNIATPAIPTTKVTGPVTATYTIAGYEFVVNAPAAYFFQDGSQYGNPEPNKGLYISKQGAYLAFPAIAGKSLQKVVVSTPTSSGSAIEIAINDANGVAAEGGTNQTINSNETVTFNLSNTTENTSYRIEVMNSKNFQINKLVLTYSDGGETPPPAGNPQITAVNPTSVNFTAAGGSQTVNVTVTDQNGAALSASGLSAPFSATVSGNAVTVTATANTGAAVSQTLTIAVAGGNSVTVPVSQAAGSVQPGGDLTLVTKVADLTAGTYYMAGFAAGAYQVWAGTLYNKQCETNPYNFTDGKLVATATDKMAEVTLEAGSSAGEFFIKTSDGQYLTVGADGKNQLILTSDKGNNSWTLTDFDDNGVKASSNAFAANMFTSTSAQSRFIRSYVTTNTTGIGGIAFFRKN
ncbi:BACON domain-containing protein [Alistipes sp.]|uniref:BACON domain-containing protein n=1 Tax=Alistipes sp. TaxID=1872444 RepID=UPI0011C6ED8B